MKYDLNAKNSVFSIIILSLVISCIIYVFSPILTYCPFVLDDIRMWKELERFKNPLVFWIGDWGLNSDYYRPLHSFPLWTIYKNWGFAPTFNHSLTLLLHIVNTTLVFRILTPLCTSLLAGAIALTYALSLPSAFVTVWPMDRTNSLTVLFFLLSFRELQKNHISLQILLIY